MSLTKALEREEKRQDQEHNKKVLESLNDLKKTLEDKDFNPQINVEAPVIPPIPPVKVEIPPQEPVKVEVKVDAPKVIEVPVIRELNVKNPEDIAKEILDEVKERITRKDPLPTIMVDEDGTPIKFTEKDTKTNKPLWRGGGSQYAAGNAVDSSLRGNVILYNDNGTLRIPSSTYKLPVEATLNVGDIQIGAVEIKNATTDDRVAVINSAPTTEFGVVTRNIPSGTQAISASSLPLPSGAATAAKQLPDNHQVTVSNAASIGGGTEYTEGAAAATDPVGKALNLVSIATPGAEVTAGQNVSARGTIKGEMYVKHVDSIPVTGTFFQATQPVSASSLPLPTGAATSANQQTDALTNTQLRATPVPISGTVTATPSGTQNVDVTANTIGLATSAKQDSLLTELQLKADLTETQPVSLASVPSHNVTNAGTFATQATLAAETTKVIGATNPVNKIYGTPSQATVGATATDIVASTTGYRKVTIKVAAAAITGIFINPNGTATSSHFLLGPGESWTFKTAQAISAIRGGASDVTVYISTATL